MYTKYDALSSTSFNYLGYIVVLIVVVVYVRLLSSALTFDKLFLDLEHLCKLGTLLFFIYTGLLFMYTGVAENCSYLGYVVGVYLLGYLLGCYFCTLGF